MGLLNGFKMVLRCELCFDTLEKQLDQRSSKHPGEVHPKEPPALPPASSPTADPQPSGTGGTPGTAMLRKARNPGTFCLPSGELT